MISALKTDPYFTDPTRAPFIEILDSAVLPQQFSSADTVASAIQGVIQSAVVEGNMDAAQAVEQAVEAARSALQATQ